MQKLELCVAADTVNHPDHHASAGILEQRIILYFHVTLANLKDVSPANEFHATASTCFTTRAQPDTCSQGLLLLLHVPSPNALSLCSCSDALTTFSANRWYRLITGVVNNKYGPSTMPPTAAVILANLGLRHIRYPMPAPVHIKMILSATAYQVDVVADLHRLRQAAPFAVTAAAHCKLHLTNCAAGHLKSAWTTQLPYQLHNLCTHEQHHLAAATQQLIRCITLLLQLDPPRWTNLLLHIAARLTQLSTAVKPPKLHGWFNSLQQLYCCSLRQSRRRYQQQ